MEQVCFGGLGQDLKGLARDAVDRGVPVWLAEEAAAIARHRLGLGEGDDLAGQAARVRGYFWGIVRNKCLESRDGRLDSLSARFVRASVATELQMRGGGRGSSDSASTVCQEGHGTSVQTQLALAL